MHAADVDGVVEVALRWRQKRRRSSSVRFNLVVVAGDVERERVRPSEDPDERAVAFEVGFAALVLDGVTEVDQELRLRLDSGARRRRRGARGAVRELELALVVGAD